MTMQPSLRRLTIAVAAIGTLALVACDAGRAGSAGGTSGAGSAGTLVQSVPAAQPAQPAQPTPTTAAVPTVPPALPTPAPEPTPHPLSIAAMRAREYPGSDLVLEQTLAPGSNYNRYIVSYRSDGLKIYALLTVPRGQRPPTGWPVVVFNHGYIPPAVYRTTERYVAYVDAFARNGYVVLRPDYRGHGSSEGEARGAYSTPDYVVDVLNAVAAVRTSPEVDPQRIGMWGHSMGGYITLRAMVISQDIKAGVIWAGVVGSYPDIVFNWGRPPDAAAGPAPAGAAPAGQNRSWRNQLVAEYGPPETNVGFWASISANTYLSDLSGPLQIHHGTADTSVPLHFSQTLDRQLRSVGGTSELFVYPGDDHDLSRNLSTALSRSVAFFNAHVKGG